MCLCPRRMSCDALCCSRTAFGQCLLTATCSGEPTAAHLLCQLRHFVSGSKQPPALQEDGREGSKGIHGRLQPSGNF